MKFISDYFKYKINTEINGLTNELNVFCILNYFNTNKESVLVLTNSLYEANKYYEAICTYTNDVLLFPMDDFISSIALAISPELKIKRLETLQSLKDNNKKIVVTNLMGLLRFLPNFDKSKKLELNLKVGDSINRDNMLEIISEFGYNRESIVTATGEYAVRGFIIDIFLIDDFHPIRIEFFGNEIDSIRYFDENTQLSISEIQNIKILPYKEIITKDKSSIVDYLNNPLIFEIDRSQFDVGVKKLSEEIVEYNNNINSSEKYMFDISELNLNNIIYLNKLDSNIVNIKENISREIDNFNSNFDLLSNFVNKCLKNNKTVVFCLSKISEINKITELFLNSIIVDEDDIHLGKINIINKKINKGFEFNNIIVISEFDIEKNTTREVNYRNTFKVGKKIKGFDQLSIGDYVVHSAHGVGIYNGVISLNKNGVIKDYILINYAGNDKVYIPVEKISSLFKYSSKDGTMPKINKLNSPSWANTKKAMQKKIKDISSELIQLYAARAAIKGISFKSDPIEDIFDADFKYEPTIDQTKAFSDVNNDLISQIPMDRLLCGDVGFGKTEVAFRAMFKTVVNNMQVFYLCPTTILSKQQYENALNRFKNFPVEIALLNRFTTKKEATRILDGLLSGKIDIVFGTHRLLSNDVKFKSLGLLVVDEEQRFGVTHKEKIKQYKNDVNVLTLSATPIPRTLKLALSGLRDLSIIDTAPINRYPVQTYVIQENDMLIKDAIYKELSRNGQIFILYNKVASIESKRDELLRLVPEARILIAHGQMNKTELEDVMDDFINFKYDILLCTTIIETGIDIANANTLIIYDADCFGLSQLYQIRGRVGRSNKVAYAYLMYNKNKMLNDIAIKRLQAIKQFTELGSGYRIAMRDLSLRGAGDILGSEQAGFVDAVGLDLYMSMVDTEIRRLNGETIEENDDSFKTLIDVDTHISDEYVSEENLKIEIHKKINEIDSYDKLNEIKNELEDRFGKIDEKILIYMYEEWFEKLALKLSINKVVQNSRIVEVELGESIVKNIKFEKVFMQAYNINPKFQFRSFGKKVYITLPIMNLQKHFIYYLVPLLNIINDELEKLNY